MFELIHPVTKAHHGVFDTMIEAQTARRLDGDYSLQIWNGPFREPEIDFSFTAVLFGEAVQ